MDLHQSTIMANKFQAVLDADQGKRIWITLSRRVKDSPDPIRRACVWL
jgi:hypothetical protein